MADLDDPDVTAEADAFLRQEALHARAHRAHTAVLVRRYPGLQGVLDELDVRYAKLTARPLRFQLAYGADIEATFTPLFDTMLRHRTTMFDNGDHRVAPVFLWHLVEEIEHRSSALIIYDAVVASPWYRLQVAPLVFRHIVGCFNVYLRGVIASVPQADVGMDPADMLAGWSALTSGSRRDAPPQFLGVPRRELATMGWRLARSQAPHHRPDGEVTPPFADEWIAAHAAGRDVVHWYQGDWAPA